MSFSNTPTYNSPAYDINAELEEAMKAFEEEDLAETQAPEIPAAEAISSLFDAIMVSNGPTTAENLEEEKDFEENAAPEPETSVFDSFTADPPAKVQAAPTACAARTSKGTPCSRKATVGSLCKQHSKTAFGQAEVAAAPVVDAIVLNPKSGSDQCNMEDEASRCAKYTKAGTRCKFTAVSSKFCARHGGKKQAPEYYVCVLFDSEGRITLGNISTDKDALEKIPFDEKLYEREVLKSSGLIGAPKQKAAPKKPVEEIPESELCNHEYKKGINKGEYCDKRATFGDFCTKHKRPGSEMVKTAVAAENRCTYFFKKGAKAGSACGRTTTVPGFCSTHLKFAPASAPIVEQKVEPESPTNPESPAPESGSDNSTDEKASLEYFPEQIKLDFVTEKNSFQLKHLDLETTTIAHNSNYLKIALPLEVGTDYSERSVYEELRPGLGYCIGTTGKFYIVKEPTEEKEGQFSFTLDEVMEGMSKLADYKDTEIRIAKIAYTGKSCQAGIKKPKAPLPALE